MPPTPPAGRAMLLAGVLVLTLTACGRRGPLEAPGAPAVGPSGASGTVGPDEERREAGALGSPVPGGRSRAARRAFTVPKDPFILDPLL